MRTPEELIADTKPFADSVIEQLPATAKRPALPYVSWTHYAQRLLSAHGGYEWTPTGVVHADGLWVVTGLLRLGDETYGAVGEDDAPAAAESNAFKRACAKAGIGLHLYEHYWLHNQLTKP